MKKTDLLEGKIFKLIKERARVYDDPKQGALSLAYLKLTKQIEDLKDKRREAQAIGTN